MASGTHTELILAWSGIDDGQNQMDTLFIKKRPPKADVIIQSQKFISFVSRVSILADGRYSRSGSRFAATRAP
jgi:hypothetical protein